MTASTWAHAHMHTHSTKTSLILHLGFMITWFPPSLVSNQVVSANFDFWSHGFHVCRISLDQVVRHIEFLSTQFLSVILTFWSSGFSHFSWTLALSIEWNQTSYTPKRGYELNTFMRPEFETLSSDLNSITLPLHQSGSYVIKYKLFYLCATFFPSSSNFLWLHRLYTRPLLHNTNIITVITNSYYHAVIP